MSQTGRLHLPNKCSGFQVIKIWPHLFWRSNIRWHSSLYRSWCSATEKRFPLANLPMPAETYKAHSSLKLSKSILPIYY